MPPGQPDLNGPFFIPSGPPRQPNEWEAKLNDFGHAIRAMLDYISTLKAIDEIKNHGLLKMQKNIVKSMNNYEKFLRKQKPKIFDEWMEKFTDFNFVHPKLRDSDMVI